MYFCVPYAPLFFLFLLDCREQEKSETNEAEGEGIAAAAFYPSSRHVVVLAPFSFILPFSRRGKTRNGRGRGRRRRRQDKQDMGPAAAKKKGRNEGGVLLRMMHCASYSPFSRPLSPSPWRKGRVAGGGRNMRSIPLHPHPPVWNY